MIAVTTTRFLITRTTRLRAWARRVDPYTAGSLLVIALIIAGGMIRNALTPAAQPPIVVFATPVLSVVEGPALPSGEHGTVQRLERAPAALRTLPTAIVPTVVSLPTPEPVLVVAPPAEQEITIQSAPEPTAGYIAHTTAGDIVIPDDATPVPASVPYDGPFLAPMSEETPADAPRLCTGFGDWRDYDPAYAASPICHPKP